MICKYCFNRLYFVSGSRQRKGRPYWHSLASSSRTSTSSYDSRDSYPALIPSQRNDDLEAKLDEAGPNRFSRVLGCESSLCSFNGVDTWRNQFNGRNRVEVILDALFQPTCLARAISWLENDGNKG